MGAIAWERWLQHGWRVKPVWSSVFRSSPALPRRSSHYPFFSLPATDAMVERLLGRVVPAVALTHDLHDEFGWRELARTVTATVSSSYPPAERHRTTIVTANYGQAVRHQLLWPGDLSLPLASTRSHDLLSVGPRESVC